jgi:hypothetical protein
LAPEKEPSSSPRISSWLRRLREILASFWTAVLSLFSKLRAPFQEFINSITPKHHTEDKEGGPPKKPPIIPNVVPSPPSDEKAKKTVYVYTPWWKTLAEMVGIIAIVAYTIVSYCQWQTAKDTLVASERPWVALDVNIGGRFTIDASGAHIPVKLILENIGHSPAVRLAIWTRFYPYRLNGQYAATEREKVCGQAIRVSAPTGRQKRSLQPK